MKEDGMQEKPEKGQRPGDKEIHKEIHRLMFQKDNSTMEGEDGL